MCQTYFTRTPKSKPLGIGQKTTFDVHKGFNFLEGRPTSIRLWFPRPKIKQIPTRSRPLSFTVTEHGQSSRGDISEGGFPLHICGVVVGRTDLAPRTDIKKRNPLNRLCHVKPQKGTVPAARGFRSYWVSNTILYDADIRTVLHLVQHIPSTCELIFIYNLVIF